MATGILMYVMQNWSVQLVTVEQSEFLVVLCIVGGFVNSYLAGEGNCMKFRDSIFTSVLSLGTSCCS